MKKFNIFGLLLLMLGVFTGCKEEAITFTSELPQFETRDGLMLLEAIVPYGTGINDQVYIVGEFNGGLDAVGDPQWLLERGNPPSGVPAKFGIYLNPSTFVNGKTLADGYYFYDIQKGPEKNIDNEPILHYGEPKLGERLNVFVDYWEDDFLEPENPDEIEHDGYAIYVINNTGWTDLAMYAWGDGEPFGGWPGMTPTGKVELNGVMYQYFDTGASNADKSLHLIFNNNNNGSQLPDFDATLDKDYYLELTADGVVELDPGATIPHDGFTVFVYNNTGWETVTLYMWGDVNNLNGDWPGMYPTGTQVVNGIGYLYFDMGESNTGLSENLIFSNDGASQLGDFAFTINRNIYLEITTKGVTEIDPDTFQPGGNTPDEPSEPEEPLPAEEYNIYIQNNTGWDEFYVYAWGDSEMFGGWPGQTSDVTKEIDGVTYMVFTVTGAGEEENLIFNNNAGVQYDAMKITVDRDYYIIANPESAEEAPFPTYHLYIDNQTGWDAFFVYAWGDEESFGGWPGASTSVTETIDGVTYLVFDITGNGNVENLIFNNNDGTQYDAMTLRFNKDYFIIAKPEGAELSDNGN